MGETSYIRIRDRVIIVDKSTRKEMNGVVEKIYIGDTEPYKIRREGDAFSFRFWSNPKYYVVYKDKETPTSTSCTSTSCKWVDYTCIEESTPEYILEFDRRLQIFNQTICRS